MKMPLLPVETDSLKSWKCPVSWLNLFISPIFSNMRQLIKRQAWCINYFFSLAKVEVNNFCHFSILSSNLHQNNNSVTCPEWARPTTAIEAQAKEICCHRSSFFLRHFPVNGKGVRRVKDKVQERRRWLLLYSWRPSLPQWGPGLLKREVHL